MCFEWGHQWHPPKGLTVHANSTRQSTHTHTGILLCMLVLNDRIQLQLCQGLDKSGKLLGTQFQCMHFLRAWDAWDVSMLTLYQKHFLPPLYSKQKQKSIRNFRAYFLINTKFLTFFVSTQYVKLKSVLEKISIRNDNLQLEIHSLYPA